MTDTATGTRAMEDNCAAILLLTTDLAPCIEDSRIGAAATSPLAEADFFLAATTLAGCIELTATLPRPRLAAATLGGMVEQRRLCLESLDTRRGGTNLGQSQLPQKDFSSRPQRDFSSPTKKNVSICASTHLLSVHAKKNTKKSKNTKDTIRKKNVHDCLSVYLRISVLANKITALVLKHYKLSKKKAKLRNGQ